MYYHWGHCIVKYCVQTDPHLYSEANKHHLRWPASCSVVCKHLLVELTWVPTSQLLHEFELIVASWKSSCLAVEAKDLICSRNALKSLSVRSSIYGSCLTRQYMEAPYFLLRNIATFEVQLTLSTAGGAALASGVWWWPSASVTAWLVPWPWDTVVRMTCVCDNPLHRLPHRFQQLLRTSSFFLSTVLH